jgi:uncharacterized protein (UPF0548 family)
MLSLHAPPRAQIERFLEEQGRLPFSYPAVGATRTAPPAGYDLDHHRVRLGAGQAAYRRACSALDRWQMFDIPWVQLCWPTVPAEPGACVVVLVRLVGIWWLNACRVVYRVEEVGDVERFGFAYGTLPGHAEMGEERFLIEWDHATDAVWYDLLAFSRPRHPLARLGYPLARRWQKRFACASLAAMRKAARG